MKKIRLFALTAALMMLLSIPAYAQESAQIEKTAFTLTGTNDVAVVRLQFPSVIEFMDGARLVRLYLDESTITTRPTRSPTYTFTATRTREITGLPRNDPALVERTWESKTLVDVSFTRTGERSYTAHAVYAGTATGTREVSFISTAKYFGKRGT